MANELSIFLLKPEPNSSSSTQYSMIINKMIEKELVKKEK